VEEWSEDVEAREGGLDISFSCLSLSPPCSSDCSSILLPKSCSFGSTDAAGAASVLSCIILEVATLFSRPGMSNCQVPTKKGKEVRCWLSRALTRRHIHSAFPLLFRFPNADRIASANVVYQLSCLSQTTRTGWAKD
jgi:hypothetical protein